MKKTYFKILGVFITILCMFTLTGCNISIDTSYGTTSSSISADKAQIYYLDVGQGDSELICLPTGETILIDAGLKSGSDRLTAYLKELGVDRIDILIATHPHADHIGGMEKVIQNFEIGEIYMPKVADDQVPTTATYTKLLEAIQAKGMKINQAKAGTTIFSNDNATLEILAPNNSEYKDLNNYSIVTKLTYGNNRFLFTGDAESDEEEEILNSGADLKSTVLKVGHHGSRTSTSYPFLREVMPQYAVISVEKGNSYGHPNEETLSKLSDAGVEVYRTDESGDIVMTSDGNSINVVTAK